MGIPKFYRWLSERYPLVNQPIAGTNVPIVDNLYFDMNGVIHNCTHGNDPGRKLTEPEMILKVFDYLDKLVHIIQPQQQLFMALDGVAPRAKMNQQRARRFKSAREREEARAQLQRQGGTVSEDDFDSNCITPGTAFMQRLGAHLRFFIRKKLAEDSVWQKPSVIFSGHEVPGEGEHKIMEHIRLAKQDPNYRPNQRHCLYGLDADLIMLSLVSHEPFFCLLREVVRFGGGGNKGQPAREILDNPCADHFILFQIGLVREYLELEFQHLQLPFPFCLERIVDDFVMFCMLTGNDFLPPLPTFDIGEGALDKVLGIYKQLLPSMGGYLTHAGELDRSRLQLLLDQLAALEQSVLEERAADAEWFESKRSKKGEVRPHANGFAAASTAATAAHHNELDAEDEFEAQLASMAVGEGPLEPEEERPREAGGNVQQEPTMMSAEARSYFLAGDASAGLRKWKERYYREKLHISHADAAALRSLVHHYIEGLEWVLQYYYRGVASWDWFFPHHFAPMASECSRIADLKIGFAMGKPFEPFQQLLAVLPASSSKLLPQPYWALMHEPSSPILDFYPTDFVIDAEGKRAEWEGVVLIPFIDQGRLLAASASVPSSVLSYGERERNRPGSIMVFEHDPESTESSFCESTLPGHLPSVSLSRSRCLSHPPPPPLPQGVLGFTPRLPQGTRLRGGAPGFASLSILKVTPELKAAAVNVLGSASKKDSVILHVQSQIRNVLDSMRAGGGQVKATDQALRKLLGKRCWMRYPYLQEALVHAISDSTQKVDSQGTTPHDKDAASAWFHQANKLGRDLLTNSGLDSGPCDLMLHLRPCEGLIRCIDGTVEKRFSKSEHVLPVQMFIKLDANKAPDPRLDPGRATAQAGDIAFPPGSQAIFLGRTHYGCVATVLPPIDGEVEGPMLRVVVQPAPASSAAAMATAQRILHNVQVKFLPTGLVARKLRLSPRTLGRVVGTVPLSAGDERVDVGLNVKHGAKNLRVADAIQPGHEGKGWCYSPALINMLQQYQARFPWVLHWLETGNESLDMAEIFPEQPREASAQQLAAVRTWLASLPLARRPLVKVEAQIAPEQAVQALQATLPTVGKPPPPIELENVSPALLLPPMQPPGSLAIASAQTGGHFDLGDRIVAVRGVGGSPAGVRGTIVGSLGDDVCEVLFDLELPNGTDLYGRCKGKFGLILPASDLLNLSKPNAVAATGEQAPRAVRHSSNHTSTPDQVRVNSHAQATTSEASPPDNAWHAKPRVGGEAKKKQASKRQPLCPPERTARGFSLGRGRPPPTAPPGAPTDPPGAPTPPPGAPTSPRKTPSQPTDPLRGEQSPAQLQSASAALPVPGQPQEGEEKVPQQQQQQQSRDAASVGHSLLAALQQGRATTPQRDDVSLPRPIPVSQGVQLGAAFLAQLQAASSGRAASPTPPQPMTHPPTSAESSLAIHPPKTAEASPTSRQYWANAAVDSSSPHLNRQPPGMSHPQPGLSQYQPGLPNGASAIPSQQSHDASQHNAAGLQLLNQLMMSSSAAHGLPGGVQSAAPNPRAVLGSAQSPMQNPRAVLGSVQNPTGPAPSGAALLAQLRGAAPGQQPQGATAQLPQQLQAAPAYRPQLTGAALLQQLQQQQQSLPYHPLTPQAFPQAQQSQPLHPHALSASQGNQLLQQLQRGAAPHSMQQQLRAVSGFPTAPPGLPPMGQQPPAGGVTPHLGGQPLPPPVSPQQLLTRLQQQNPSHSPQPGGNTMTGTAPLDGLWNRLQQQHDASSRTNERAIHEGPPTQPLTASSQLHHTTQPAQGSQAADGPLREGQRASEQAFWNSLLNSRNATS